MTHRKHYGALVPTAEVELVLALLKDVDLAAPLTADERRSFDASRAREMARAEAKRQPHPQGEMEV